jgi:hypothetical protein
MGRLGRACSLLHNHNHNHTSAYLQHPHTTSFLNVTSTYLPRSQSDRSTSLIIIVTLSTPTSRRPHSTPINPQAQHTPHNQNHGQLRLPPRLRARLLRATTIRQQAVRSVGAGTTSPRTVYARPEEGAEEEEEQDEWDCCCGCWGGLSSP